MQKNILFIFLLFTVSLQGQITDDFSDGDLETNPEWFGDKTNFIVNSEQVLQLMAPEAGTSLLYTDIQIGPDMEWDFIFTMDFSPSGSNKTTIYLVVDDADVSQANGYGITVGESGSDDALIFFKLVNGSKENLGTGTLGAMAVGPSVARVHVSLMQNSNWIISADYTGANSFETEIEVVDKITNSGSSFFVLECRYTSTRTEHFFFDDFVLPFIPDITPPLFESSFIDGTDALVLCFNENVQLPDIDNITVTPSLPISAITYYDLQENKVRIHFNEDIVGGVDYALDIDQIRDLSENGSSASDISFSIISPPVKGDLVVNEILADPASGGFDFVEILNRSGKKISLANIGIANLDKDEFDYIENIEFLEAGGFLALCKNIGFLEDTYTIQNPLALHENDIPSFNISDGNVSIVLDDGITQIVIDSFDYNEDLHYALLETTKGVSLERLSTELDANNPENWHSASSAAGFATPGYENSNASDFVESDNTFALDKKVFSPDGDGFEDLIFLNYAFDKPGYLININIFDANGRFILNLEESLNPSIEGFVKWDGLNSESRRTPIGLYIMHVSGFHPDGDKVENKLVFAIAEQL